MSLQERAALSVHPLPEGLPAAPDWRLRIDGLVEQPAQLDTAQLAALPGGATTDDFACEEGWVVPDQRWEGVRLADVLAIARPLPAARWVLVSAGGFSVALPLEEAFTGALLAYRLNGAPLAREHGAPLRLVAAGRECFFSVKWVERLELLAAEPNTTGADIARSRIKAVAD